MFIGRKRTVRILVESQWAVMNWLIEC